MSKETSNNDGCLTLIIIIVLLWVLVKYGCKKPEEKVYIIEDARQI